MTAAEIRDKIIGKYKVGQVANIRFRNDQGKIMDRKKARILKHYSHHVLCEVDNCKESFTYGEFKKLTAYSNKKGGS